ncbi:unnamed protein product [Parajaminaea phylloscopi]
MLPKASQGCFNASVAEHVGEEPCPPAPSPALARPLARLALARLGSPRPASDPARWAQIRRRDSSGRGSSRVQPGLARTRT